MPKEISEEEVNAFWEKKNKRDAEDRLRISKCEDIKAKYESGDLQELTPLWHTTIKEGDLDKQPHKLNEEYLIEGVCVKEVDIEELFDSFYCGNAQMFRERILFQPDLMSFNICDIIGHWLNGEELLPPTIYHNPLKDASPSVKSLFPIDGKHRINVAYYFGAKTIPVILPKSQLAIIGQKIQFK